MIGALMAEAAEQEQKEMLLAYFFLWEGRPQPASITSSTALLEVDRAIEEFLHEDIARTSEAASKVDFDMQDAISDLQAAGAVVNDGKGNIRAVPIDQAIECLSVKHFPEDSCGLPARAGKSNNYLWEEQYATGPFGQVHRLFVNTQTLEQSYRPPEKFKPYCHVQDEPRTPLPQSQRLPVRQTSAAVPR